MPAIKSREERLAIGEAYHNGLKVSEVVKRYGVSKSSAYAARVLYRKENALKPAPAGGDDLAAVRQQLSAAMDEIAILQKVVMVLGRAL